MPGLRRTPLAGVHERLGARMVEFAGFSMPVHYTSIREEHAAVREAAGLFDVSHMGRFTFEGKDAVRFLDRVCTRQVAGMQDGQARYSLVCNENGGCKDDVLVYRRAEGQYSMVCNASNRLKLIEHFDAVRGDLPRARDRLDLGVDSVLAPKDQEHGESEDSGHLGLLPRMQWRRCEPGRRGTPRRRQGSTSIMRCRLAR